MDPNIPQQQEQQVPPAPVSQPIAQKPSVTPSNHSKLLFIIIGVLILIIAGMGVYIFNSKKNQSSESIKQASKSAIPTSPTVVPTTTAPSVTVNPTVNWKTYTSSADKLSFKYPNDWKLTTARYLATGYDEISVGGTNGSIQVNVFKAIFGQHISSNWQPNTNLIIDGANCQGIQINFQPRMQNPPNTSYECVIKGMMYEITAVPLLNKNHTTDYSVVNSILSTFKFTQ